MYIIEKLLSQLIDALNNVYSYVENANVIETGTHNLESGKVLQNVEALESESSWKSSESYPIIESSVDFGYNRYIIIKIRIVSMNFYFEQHIQFT